LWLWLLFATAAAQQPDGRIFIGVEAGSGGPVYFGFEGAIAETVGAAEYNLEGRLRLGNVLIADGEAWAGWRPLENLRLRAGYGAWFLDAAATGRAPGLRGDWSATPSFGLAVAYTPIDGKAGLGAVAAIGTGAFQLWLRNDGWLAAARIDLGRAGISGWCRSDYAYSPPEDYGLEIGWHGDVLSLSAGYSSYWGLTATAGAGLSGFSLSASGHWYPGRSGGLTGGLALPLDSGAAVVATAEYGFAPVSVWNASLEFKLPLEPQP